MDKKLANKFSIFLGKLPDDELKRLIKTQDQLEEWLTARNMNNHIAKCFQARFTGKNDPIENWKNEGKLQHLKWELVWQSVDVYESLWSLIQLCYGDIRDFLLQLEIVCPYPSAFNLFLEIVKINENTVFSKCLKPHHREVVTQNEQFFKLVRDKAWKGQLKDTDQKKLNQLCKNFDENLELLNFVWAVCLFKAQSNSLIGAKVREFKNKEGSLCGLISKIYGDSRKDRIHEGKLTSVTWSKGFRN